MVPLQTVKKDGFRVMIKTLDSRYVFMPLPKYFSKPTIQKLYQQHRSKLETALRTVAHFSTTPCLWSMQCSYNYLTIFGFEKKAILKLGISIYFEVIFIYFLLLCSLHNKNSLHSATVSCILILILNILYNFVGPSKPYSKQSFQ